MRNNKGQALVEFILILPVFILLIITMLDFGNILLKSYSLEHDLDIISEMYKNSDADKLNQYVTENNIRVMYTRDDGFITINLYQDISIISPVLIPIMGSVYEINTSGVYYE